MSRDYFRNRQSLGSIKQMPVVVPVFSITKNLLFDVSTDLTSNFTQRRGSNATQTVTGGVVQFRNGTYDQENGITSNFSVGRLLSLYLRHNWWRGGSASQESYNFKVQVLNAAGAVVTTLALIGSYSHTYKDRSPEYYNPGYLFWRFATDANSNTSKRLCAFPSQGAHHTYELIDLTGGYYQFKLDGVAQGSNIYLGDPTYKLGGVFTFDPLGGWFNSNIYDDLDTFTAIYL